MMTKLLTYSLFTVLSLVSSTSAHPGHHHHRRAALPGTWHHSREHPVNALFKRQLSGDLATYPEVGSPTWLAKYPTTTPVAAQMPKEWQDALAAVVAAGKVPNVPRTTVEIKDGNKVPHYPSGVDGLKPEICSTTMKCQHPGAIWDGPPGTFGTGFDDGPVEFTPKLLDFLKSQNEKATHFMIGITMVQNIGPLKATIASGHDLAVHTYTHPVMTSLTNEDIVAELGWTMQIIHDSTGGKVPKYWRPPLGDSDNRVLAIASEVFGLKAILWRYDTNDWGLPSGATSKQTFNTTYQSWLNLPKASNPGLIILEHETSAEAVQGFIDAFPAIKAAGWKMAPVTSLVDNAKGAYSNVDAAGKISQVGILKNNAAAPPAGNSSAPSGSKTVLTPTSSGSAPTPSKTNGASVVLSNTWILASMILGSLLSLA